MKRSTARLLSTLLVLCMVLALLPGTAWAGGDTSWAIRIRYDKDDKNEVEILADQTTPLSGEGWSYEPASNTLILDGFEGYSISFYDGDETVGDFTLELRGTNKLSGNDYLSHNLSFGSVKSRDNAATATITGSGSIELDSLNGNNIDIVMKGGTIATSGGEIAGYGVRLINCNFRMTGGTLNAIGSRYGIYVEPGTTENAERISIVSKVILESGTVTAHGDYAAIWIQKGYNSIDKTVLGTDMLDFGGRTPVGGNDESDRQNLFVKDVKKELPNPLPDGTIITRTEYIISLTSGKLTPGTEMVYWEKGIGAAKYAYISNAGQTTTPDTPDTPSTPSFKIELSAQNLTVDDKENVACEKYNIDGSNYFKLRDLAALLSGTGSQFEVGYDDASKTISITTGKDYTRVGGELEIRGDLSSKAEVSAQSLQIDGVTYDSLKVYNIGGNNFFQLRQLGDILSFDVDYDPAGTGTAIVRSK